MRAPLLRNVLLLSALLSSLPGSARAGWGDALWSDMLWGAPVLPAVPALPGGGWLLAAFLGGSAMASLLLRRRRAATALAALALAAPLMAHADDIVLPHQFVNGTVADADEVNANFDAVGTAFDEFTDRFGRDPSSPLGGATTFTDNCVNRVVGEVWQWVGNYAPRGTQLAHGQIVSIVQYPVLHFLVGDSYGGDNVTTFGLPDLRGLEPEGVNYVICMFGIFPSVND